ncbi:tRNA (adenosine(37)-N6)-dimethylallyltransferase MiaA [Alkalilimnicola ehrlichii]|uniref:tRNA dimethylallyltransferase n=1 Tax=Alkalilimnicola ehrlichii TaxID=351052 RepID=A0A3E0WYD9_9GAMM|nr:tRNA (adenosine(37)-N6)-dimethylallyltransferase MiaA [Alkalilimnicola ehrlichii]RFA30463.1 tRNA (adenosine(37)-N6)-dimethylallyltransferase MiaA [Alkalilimnicola ehrlichii]RFA38014.1 tRNA (adenosine(37)-N6)-dimethylallyltransferase MiaA [Alkalilimnicola ehrlichii]
MARGSESKAPVIMLMGPTASGKTGIAVELAQRLPVDIISVDSALVYRGMDIGTAKPSPHVLAQAPHRLVDILDPEEAYSAAQFRSDALREIAASHAKGRLPLLVGGTMLYFRALEQGLADLPEADSSVRARLAEEAAKQGWAKLHERLGAIDPVAAARIHCNDPQRIQRALEVYELTGQPLTRLLDRANREPFPFPVAKWVVAPRDRRWLHERIAERFTQMLGDGFVDEVAGLRKRPDLNRECSSMRAVGYRQVWDYLEGEYDYETMTSKGIIATRQFAKRQLTWLRSEQGCEWYSGEDGNLSETLYQRAASLFS